MKTAILNLLMATLMSISTGAFSQSTSSVPATTDLKKLQTLNGAALKSVKQLAAADASCKKDSDCVGIAIGSRACGGPREFLTTSQTNLFYMDGVISLLAERTVDLEEIINGITGNPSICVIETLPQVVCSRNICLTK